MTRQLFSSAVLTMMGAAVFACSLPAAHAQTTVQPNTQQGVLGQAWQQTRSDTSAAWDKTKAGTEKAWDKTRNGSETAWDKTKSGTEKAWD
ncbi:MAG: endoglucanase, partial [Acetobacter sp.]